MFFFLPILYALKWPPFSVFFLFKGTQSYCGVKTSTSYYLIQMKIPLALK
jgi:hypothetical protein